MSNFEAPSNFYLEIIMFRLIPPELWSQLAVKLKDRIKLAAGDKEEFSKFMKNRLSLASHFSNRPLGFPHGLC